MNQEKVGILGGMGTAAGIYFAQKLIELNTTAKQDADHAPFILYSNPHIPNRVNAYLESADSPVPSVVSSLEKLSTLGADFGVVICNTAHIYFDEIASRVEMPLINMVENAAIYASTLKGAKIGLLATAATVKSGLYSKYFTDSDCEIVIPTEQEQESISAAIFDREYGLKATGLTASEKGLLAIASVAHNLRERNGVDHLLLGCTELSFAIQQDSWMGFDIIDPVKILALSCLQRVSTVN